MELLSKVFNLIFPPRCVICDNILSGELMHKECVSKITRIDKHCCKICGKYINLGHICDDCKKYKHYFDRGISVFIYNQHMKKSLSKFKYSNRQEYAKFYSLEMAKKLIKSNIEIDLIIPIPIHKRRLAKRGYNQSELIATEISKILKINCNLKILKRIKNTVALKELSKEKRIETMSNAIAFNSKISMIDKRNILLVDDIYTTGTTIDVCSKVLKENGANKVYFITVAS